MPEPLLAALCAVALFLPVVAGLITTVVVRDAKKRVVAVMVVWLAAVGVAAGIIATSILDHPEWYTAKTPAIMFVILAIIGNGWAVISVFPPLMKSLVKNDARRRQANRRSTYRR